MASVNHLNEVLGAQIDRYRVVKQLGEGGFGCVFLGVDENSKHQAAIKLLDFPPHAGCTHVQDPQLESYFANALRHPNLVAVISWGIDSQFGRYLVSDYVDGETLADRVQRLGQAWPLSDVLHVAHQLAAAMAALHARGVVHGDLTLRNILVQPDDAVPGGLRARILDFGLSRFGPAYSELAEGSATKFGDVPGTGQYLAPEVRQAGFSRASDVFSLGIVLNVLFEGYPVPASLTALWAQMTGSAPRGRPTMAEVAALLLRAWRKEKPGQGSRTVLLAGSVLGGMLAGFVALLLVRAPSFQPAPPPPPSVRGTSVALAPVPAATPAVAPVSTMKPAPAVAAFPPPPTDKPPATLASQNRLRHFKAPTRSQEAAAQRRTDDVRVSPGRLLRTLPPKHLALPFGEVSPSASDEP